MMDPQKPFILVVDDDDDDRYMLHTSFADLGMEEHVKFFGDSIQFMRYLELIGSLTVQPSLIILDYRMPYMNGKALLHYLKNNSPFQQVPVVILSSDLDESIRTKLSDLGAAACFCKGQTQEEVLDGLRDILDFVQVRG